jgi:CheY-like chemotaxis protein
LIERDTLVAEAVVGFLQQGGDVAEVQASVGGLQNGGPLPDVVLIRAELAGSGGGLDGCAVADGIKAAERTQDLPVVVYWTDSTSVELHRSGATPADAYLGWPFSADMLLDQIHLLTDGAALAVPLAEPEGGDHLIAEEEVAADGELESLFSELPSVMEMPGAAAPVVAAAPAEELPQISPEFVQPLEEVVEEGPEPTPAPLPDPMARATYDPLAVGLSLDQEIRDEDPRDDPEPPEADPGDMLPPETTAESIPAPPPALEAVDAELQELVAGLDAVALESTKELPAFDDHDLDALAEEALIPLPSADLAESAESAESAGMAEPAPPVAPDSLDAAVEAEFGIDLPPPPSADLAPPAASTAPAHTGQMEAALEAAGQAATAARQQAEAAREQVEEIAAQLRATEDRAATERAQLAAMIETVEAERVRAAALEQDVVRLGRELEQAQAAIGHVKGELESAQRSAAAQQAEAEAATAQAVSEALAEGDERSHEAQRALALLQARSARDEAVFERVGKAVRIAMAVLEDRSK